MMRAGRASDAVAEKATNTDATNTSLNMTGLRFLDLPYFHEPIIVRQKLGGATSAVKLWNQPTELPCMMNATIECCEGVEKRTFECSKCHHVETRVTVADPIKSGDARGWISGELGTH
jgi:hypothetical protein